jgi:tripeptidyl-peptidase-1
MLVTTTFLASLLALVIAKPTVRSSLVVHDQRTAAPQGFTGDGAAPSDTLIDLRIGLFSNNIAGLEKVLYDVSTPSSPQYGQYLSKAEARMI